MKERVCLICGADVPVGTKHCLKDCVDVNPYAGAYQYFVGGAFARDWEFDENGRLVEANKDLYEDQ